MDDMLAWERQVIESRRAVCRCDRFVSAGGAGTLCATAQGTIARLGQPSEGSL